MNAINPHAWPLPRTLLQDYLPSLRGMSLNTIRSYRDALVLFLQFAANIWPSDRSIGDRKLQRDLVGRS